MLLPEVYSRRLHCQTSSNAALQRVSGQTRGRAHATPGELGLPSSVSKRSQAHAPKVDSRGNTSHDGHEWCYLNGSKGELYYARARALRHHVRWDKKAVSLLNIPIRSCAFVNVRREKAGLWFQLNEADRLRVARSHAKEYCVSPREKHVKLVH